jgi:hypothetical protein
VLCGFIKSLYTSAMSLMTIEVEIDHGKIIPKGTGFLPDHAVGLLTIFDDPKDSPVRNPLAQDPTLWVVSHEDLTAPLHPEDWPEAFEPAVGK